MKNSVVLLATIFGLTLIGGYSAYSQNASAQGTFSLQGKLTTGISNTAIADGQYTLNIKVYETGTGNVVTTESDVVNVMDGVFSTMIGDNTALSLKAGTNYEIGVSVDGGAELMPRIMIGSAPNAITANLAANATALNGMMVSANGDANTIVATNAQGRIDASLLNKSINVTGSGVSVSTEGGMLNLSITGGGSGSFELPFTGSAAANAGQSALRITSTGAGSAAALLNTGTGSALNLSSNNSSSAALDISNTGGSAINAVGSADATALLKLQNTSSNANAGLITALNADGEEAFQVMGNGRTVINSTVGDALEVHTSAAGEAALKVVGGLTLDGPVGTGTLTSGLTSVTINNPLVDANSVILLTINSATSLTNGLRISGQGNGSFTVSLLDTALGALAGNVNFNYLIINGAGSSN